MSARTTADTASLHRQAVGEQLTHMGCRITSQNMTGMRELILPQHHNILHIHATQITIDIGFLLAQMVYPWPNWRAAQLDFRESYPAYLKYGAHPLPRRLPWQFLRPTRKAALATEVMQLRTKVIGNLRQYQVELRPHTGHEYTLFMIPHELSRPQYILVGYLIAQFIYPHIIWDTAPLRLESDPFGNVVFAVTLLSEC